MFFKFLKISQNAQENTCVGVSFVKKEIRAPIFSCEICNSFKSRFP